MDEHQYFFIDIFHNLVDSNLSKVCTDAKANPEFIKPERQEMSYCKDNHICVYGSDYHFAKSLSCTMRNVEQNARICLLMGTWLEIRDVAHVILCGDDRFILCADDHLSQACIQSDRWRNSSSLLALLLRKTSQFAGIGAPAITYCHCAFYDPL